LTCYSLEIHNPITTVFGRSVAEKVTNQTMLVFPPHLSSVSALPCKIGNPEDSALCMQYSPTLAALSTSFLLNHAPNSPARWMHWLHDLGSYTALWVWVVSQKDWRNQTAGWLKCCISALPEFKMQCLCFSVLPGSAEAQVICGGIVICLLIACSISNISAKKYQNPFPCLNVIAIQRWDLFLRHSVDGSQYRAYLCHTTLNLGQCCYCRPAGRSACIFQHCAPTGFSKVTFTFHINWLQHYPYPNNNPNSNP